MSLDYDGIARRAEEYLRRPLVDAFWEAFEDDVATEAGFESEVAAPSDEDLRNWFEQARMRPRIFIVAGDIPERIGAIARFLRRHNLDVTCLSVQQSVEEEPRLLGVSAIVGGEQSPLGASTISPGPSFDQVVGKAYSANAELGKLLERLCVGTRQLRSFSEKPGASSVAYRLKLPGSRGPRSIVRYSPYYKGGRLEFIQCTLWPANVAELVRLDEPKLLRILREQFGVDKVGRGREEINVSLKRRADGDAWLEILRELLSGSA